MRFLLSSLCLIFLTGCASYPTRQGFQLVEPSTKVISNPYFSDPAKDYVYKAKIDVLNRSFGGIFIVKKLDVDHHRIVFTTELGNTIFDFTFQDEDFIVNRVLKEMDKKILINILKKDFKVLIEENLPVEKAFIHGDSQVLKADILSKNHYYFYPSGQLKKIFRTSNGKEKVRFQYSGIKGNIAEEIHIDHQNFRLHIVLKAI
ncbi:MAG: hypothetical protein HKN31_04525 [Pricia sp.]|nr:hypothetical protein [Pricia sp.]